MNLKQIKAAITDGKRVFWSSELYEVILDNIGQYLIICRDYGQNCIGLTWRDGKTLNGEEKEFFTL